MHDDKKTWDEFKREVDRSVRGTDVLFFISWMSPYGLFVRRGPQGVTITDEGPGFSTDDDHTKEDLFLALQAALAKKMKPVEDCIAWAAQTGYCFADDAAAALGEWTRREMWCDQPYYNAHAWRNKDKTEEQLEEEMEGEFYRNKESARDQ